MQERSYHGGKKGDRAYDATSTATSLVRLVSDFR